MVGIKDFDIPSCCSECQMASCKGLSGQFYCDITTYDVDMDDTERDADCPLIEAIPKDQYEARLKADMVAMLTDIQLEIEELDFFEGEEPINITQELMDEVKSWEYGVKDCKKLIQSKIDKLKEKDNGK